MPDPNINKKISELPDATSLSDADELVLARSDVNYKVTGAQIKAAASTPTPAGSDTQVQFNDGGVLSSNPNFTFNKTSGCVTAKLKGISNGGDAASGVIGEYISSSVTSANAPTTDQHGDITSIALTAGDWDVIGQAYFNKNGATFSGELRWYLGLSTTSGNSGSGMVAGLSILAQDTPANKYGSEIVIVRFNLASAATVYLKTLFNSYATATPSFAASLQARRIR